MDAFCELIDPELRPSARPDALNKQQTDYVHFPLTPVQVESLHSMMLAHHDTPSPSSQSFSQAPADVCQDVIIIILQNHWREERVANNQTNDIDMHTVSTLIEDCRAFSGMAGPGFDIE